MNLFGIGKKKENTRNEKPCCCSCGQQKEALQPQQQNPVLDEITSIKVLGAGCKSCKEQYAQAKAAVSAMGLSVEVEYITDMEEIMAYSVISMPAIVVNEKVVSTGQVLKAARIEKLLQRGGKNLA